MLYSTHYSESDDDSYYLSEVINNGLVAANQSDIYDLSLYFSSFQHQLATHHAVSMPPSPSSVHSLSPGVYDEDPWLWKMDVPFLDADLDRVLQDVLDYEDDVSQQQSIPSPPIPTTVDDMDSDVFVRDSVTPPSPTLPPIDSAVRQKPIGGGVRRRRQRQRQLWQFLLEILADDRYSPSIIEWVRRDDGVFRFVKPRSVAELWGKRRRRDHMTYEHLSRAMRYYYRRGVMRRVVDLGRLVYQFLSNAEGWREYTRRG